MMNRMIHTCQFVTAAQMLRFPQADRKPADVICGRPAEREVPFNTNMEPFWLCAEHYDVVLGVGGSDRRMPLWKSN
jgi:hypothetical protein